MEKGVDPNSRAYPSQYQTWEGTQVRQRWGMYNFVMHRFLYLRNQILICAIIAASSRSTYLGLGRSVPYPSGEDPAKGRHSQWQEWLLFRNGS
jgi:hypothetical protein